MKYALLIYSPATADEYATAATAGRQAAAGKGPWTDYTQAAKDAGVLLGAAAAVAIGRRAPAVATPHPQELEDVRAAETHQVAAS